MHFLAETHSATARWRLIDQGKAFDHLSYEVMWLWEGTAFGSESEKIPDSAINFMVSVCEVNASYPQLREFASPLWKRHTHRHEMKVDVSKLRTTLLKNYYIFEKSDAPLPENRTNGASYIPTWVFPELFQVRR